MAFHLLSEQYWTLS